MKSGKAKEDGLEVTEAPEAIAESEESETIAEITPAEKKVIEQKAGRKIGDMTPEEFLKWLDTLPEDTPQTEVPQMKVIIQAPVQMSAEAQPEPTPKSSRRKIRSRTLVLRPSKVSQNPIQT